jgi:excisionase family DNA binding protein
VLSLLKIEDAAQQLQVSKSSVRRLISNGELPAVKIGKSVRIRSDDWDQFMTKLINNGIRRVR